MSSCAHGDIKDHDFFRNIDWVKIENKEIPPVFKPSVVSKFHLVFQYRNIVIVDPAIIVNF